MSLKKSLRKYPRVKKVAQILRGDQILALNYPVEMKPRYDGGPHPQLWDLISAGTSEYRNRLQRMLDYESQLVGLRDVKWVNGFLPALDSIGLYTMISELKPKTYLEVGSGNSTIFARKAIDNNSNTTKLISIDPHPRAEVDKLCDEVLRIPVEQANLELFSRLDSGDILFIDNSHRCLPNSDVTVFFMDILPSLKPGVFVHLHDICLPWDYPKEVAEEAYSEQYLLGTLLLMGNRLKTLLPNQFISKQPDLISILNPLFDKLGDVERLGVSYWLMLL